MGRWGPAELGLVVLIVALWGAVAVAMPWAS